MNGFLDFLSNTSVILTLAAILIIAFARSIISIFKMGVMFKTTLATKEEMEAFKSEMRKEMHDYAEANQKVILNTCIKFINSKLEDMKEVKLAAEDIKVIKKEIELELKKVQEKSDEMKDLANQVKILNTKVTRLEYSDEKTTGNRSERRSE